MCQPTSQAILHGSCGAMRGFDCTQSVSCVVAGLIEHTLLCYNFLIVHRFSLRYVCIIVQVISSYTMLCCHACSSPLLQESGHLQLRLGQSPLLSLGSPSPRLTAGGLWCMEEGQTEEDLGMPMHLSWTSECVQYGELCNM